MSAATHETHPRRLLIAVVMLLAMVVAAPLGAGSVQAAVLPQQTATGLPPHPDVRFGTSAQIGHGWPAAGVVHPGDWDRNGFDDMMLIRADGTLWFYPASSADRFGTARQVGHGWQSMDLVVGGVDWNGDGNPDLIARRSDGRLFAYFGNGSGGFRGSAQIGHGWTSMRTITPVQLSIDGRPGVIATGSDGRMTIYPTAASGAFTTAVQLGRGWTQMSHIVAAGDWDGNGRTDLLAVDAEGYLRLYTTGTTGSSFAGYQIGHGWGGATSLGATAVAQGRTALRAVFDSRLRKYEVSLTSTPPPSTPSAIRAAWLDSGGASGPLGAEAGAETCHLAEGQCIQYFANGAILWSPGRGTVIVRNDQPPLFVYGTLRGGQSNYGSYLAGRTVDERPAVQPGYSMWIYNSLAFAVPDAQNTVGVVGETMFLRRSDYANTMSRIDALERYYPNDPAQSMYVRVRSNPNNGLTTWLYTPSPRWSEIATSQGRFNPTGDWLRW